MSAIIGVSAIVYDKPMVTSAGRFRVNLVVPAPTEIAWSPLDGDSDFFVAEFIWTVPLLVQLGTLT